MASLLSPTRSIGSRSKEQWNDISLVHNVSEFHSSIHPVLSLSPAANNDNMAAMRISARQVGSGSRSQWAAFEKPEKLARSATELDLALGDVPAAAVSSSSSDEGDHDDDDDDASTYMESEATYDYSEVTAVTENVSKSSPTRSRVTPENSPGEGRNRSRNSDQRRGYGRSQITSIREESPEPRRLAMCGAVDVNGELKESFRDVNETVRQILSTVRRFGPDDKDAVRETCKDAKYFMKEKVRAALLWNNNNNSRFLGRECMDENSPRRRQGRETCERSRSTLSEARRRERVPVKARAGKSAEVMYDKKMLV